MTPLKYFEDLWARVEVLPAIHGFIASRGAAVLQPDEILRAAWVARVSALDLYVHELVAQRMRRIFEGSLPPGAAFASFKIPADVLVRIRAATSAAQASAAFDLEVRRQHGFLSFQDPIKIADAVRLVSTVELWNEVAVHQGASPSTKVGAAKALRGTLSAIVDRRNKIAHEGDLQPSVPRVPWPISAADDTAVANFIERLVRSIDAVVV
jgi:hypothetical protein